jgi:hypothetical protein
MVISPITPLLQRDGFDIALISVELWPSETIVRLAALVDDPAAEESALGGAVDQWVDDGREGAFPLDPGDRSYDPSTMSGSQRMFRLRMRPGRSMLTASSDPELEAATSAAAGDEVVVSEETAAFLVRQRAADIVEVIEAPLGDGAEPER